jgi:dTDP-4-amino-4,6-dideoxygalactose transaminase
MKVERIPFAIPEICDEEINEVIDSLKSGWVTTGPKTKKFEENFSKYIGVRHSLAVNSATSGLHLALDAIGIKRGDKVIVPVNTFTSTAEVVRYFDADPIFCDIDPNTFNISPKSLKNILETHEDKELIKAIMPVHVAGQACEMSEILSLAKTHKLKVIEDAAHALPTTYNGKMIGTLSDITVYSFYATKTLCTGEGGMVVTNNDDYANRIKVMRLHGFDRDAWDRYNSDKPSWYYSIVAPGFKYNMNDLAAAMGIHQLNKADIFYEKRKAIAEKYNSAFANLAEIQTPIIQNPDDKHAYHLYILKVPQRDLFIEKLSEKGIGSSVHFIPLHLQPYWQEKYKLKEDSFPEAMNNFKSILSLPIFTKLTENQVDYIIQSVKEIYEEIV